MTVQRQSVKSIIERCRILGTKTVAVGPLFTSVPADFATVDHLVLGEAEITLGVFMADLEKS